MRGQQMHIVKDEHDLISPYIVREGFAFTELTKKDVFDALVVNTSAGTQNADECIDFINHNRLESAVFFTNDMSLLKQCPTIKHFTLYPADGNNIVKYYSLPMLQGIRNFSLDSRGINELYTGGSSPLYFQKLKTLKHLNMRGTDEKSDDKKASIKTIEDFDLPELTKLSIIQCGITSLKGIENCPKLQWLDLSYMRNLSDISGLATLAPTLRMLAFENCPKLTDFSVISELKELEYLELKGKNELPNINFIKALPKLKFLILTMNVLDGDMSCLQRLQYVDAVCKRHYNLKSQDLPKDRTDLGFEFK
jgi:hypothetical protein